MGEVLQYEAGSDDSLDPAKHDDIEEVLNYRRAMRQATEDLKSLPLSNRLIKGLHETLMAGVRGHDKARGQFRTIQNYIGVYGRPVEEARFVPIAPEALEGGMSCWERYLHKTTQDNLVQLAIAHAEFESLHPFLDGNGRLGRMLIPLFLFDRKLLQTPMFYLSEYLEANRQEYYDRLLAVSSQGDWTGWCVFFLEGLRKQAQVNEAKARKILDLYQHRKEWFVDLTRSQYAIRALDWFFSKPIFKVPDFVATSGIPEPTAKRLVRMARDNDMLKNLTTGKGRRPGVVVFSELLNIAEGRTVF
jgi:Fic family protein